MKHLRKRLLALAMAVMLVVGLVPTALAADADVAADSTTAAYINAAVASGLLDGIVDATADPTAAMTRAQTVTVLYRLAGAPEVEGETAFTDLADDWYQDAVVWAVAAGIITGRTADTFDPDGLITRQELAAILYRFSGSPAVEADLSAWADSAAVLDYAVDAVAWAVDQGILAGYEGALLPRANVTLAEAATIAVGILYADESDTVEATVISGSVTSIAKYGNLELSIPEHELLDAGCTYGDMLTITVNGAGYEVPYCTSYSDVDTGSLVLRASDGALTLAINMGDFATTYGIATKTTFEDSTYEWVYAEGVEDPIEVTITLLEAGAYYDEWSVRQLERTDAREDYAELSDEEFANFRAIATTGMGTNVLYRSSSPINPEIGRNTYADAAVEAAGIQTVVNLSDDEATAAAYEGYADTYYAGINVIYLNLGVDFTAEDFQAGLANGLRYLAENEGPYLVHCNEGKDRAGFVSALLECFMGASYDEVIADYMVTYANYYGVEADSEQYDYIASSNIVKSLQTAFGVDDLATADLQQGATSYLLSIGLTEAELTALATNLSQNY